MVDELGFRKGLFYNTPEVARGLKVTPACLKKWRREKKPPKYHRFGNKAVRYSGADLLEFIDNSR